MRARSRQLVLWLWKIAADLADEIWISAGTVAVALGFWWTWRPGAYFAVGLVILWLALPSRGPFVMRPPEGERRKTE